MSEQTCPDCGGQMARLEHHPEDPDHIGAPSIIWGTHRPAYGCKDPIEVAYGLGWQAARRRERMAAA